MQYAPTAYRKKRPFLPIYLGASRKEKEEEVEGCSPLRRGVLHTPHKWPRQGTSTEEEVEGRSPVCRGAKAYAPQTIREDRMIESECPYLSPFGNKRRPTGSFPRP